MISVLCATSTGLAAAPVPFTHTVIDTTPPYNPHCKAVGDIDGDGFDDILVAGAGSASQGLFWYRYPTWAKVAIVPPDSVVPFTTDMQVGDVDRDGDLDVIVPQGHPNGFSVVWYENPRPFGDPSLEVWIEHAIGDGAAHDLEVGDVDFDGRLDVVARQDSTTLFTQDGAGGWTTTVISRRTGEGTSLGDIDHDGDLDIAVNGYWLENPLPLGDPAAGEWTEREVDASAPLRVGVAIDDLDGDGRADIVLAPSETAHGTLTWYGSADPLAGFWTPHTIDTDVSYVHTFEVADMDGDGRLDVVTAEMEQSDDPDLVRVYRNDGAALAWTQDIVDTTGSHNIRVTDIGRDGDLDIVGANWSGASELVLWRNDLDPALGLDAWQRHVVDGDRPWRAIFVTTSDMDGDGLDDIVTGGWWYRNPGTAGGVWARDTVGVGLNNMAAVADFDRDGDADVLGTRGVGSTSSDSLVWAQNDGAGAFTLYDNVDVADGDFLQGVAVAPFAGDARPRVMLSWHKNPSTLQRLIPPTDPTSGAWAWDVLAPASQREALSTGDIDRDGDIDVLQGTQWLRNDSTAWTPFTVFATAGEPDRNRLADVNNDGRLDAVVGYVAISVPGKLAWYEQGSVATDTWSEHVIASVTGPMSVDAVDMDGDGDIDVVVGEHNLVVPSSATLWVFENADGAGTAWIAHSVYTGDEHHDGAHSVDIDNDGDMDIVSIGWGHNRVLLYENLAHDAGAALNNAPVAAISVTPAGGSAPVEVTFDATGSYDPDGDALSYAWDFGDSSATAAGDSVVHTYTTEGTFTARLTVSDGEFTAVDSVSIVVGNLPGTTDGLAHQWRFDEGAGVVAGDAVGDADGALAGGGPVWVFDGVPGGAALHFDGVDDRVELGALDVSPDSGLTITLWMNADDFGVSDARLISKATGVQNQDHYWMVSTISQTALRFRLKAGGSTTTLASNTGELVAGRWYHVAVTYDGAEMRIYKDGAVVASTPKSGAPDTSSTVPASIGSQPDGAGGLAFDGRIDDVRIYHRALSESEIDSMITHTVTVSVDGSGAVTLSPDKTLYAHGDTVVVTALPDPLWSFTGWGDGLAGTVNPETLVVVSDTSIAATFARTHYALGRGVMGSGNIVAVPDTSAYMLGDSVFLTALPDSGWTFAGWLGALSGSENPDTVVISGDTLVAAVFTDAPVALARSVTGAGTIVATPDWAVYPAGTGVAVEALPDSGYVFISWGGALDGTASPDTLLLAADTTLTATFALAEFPLDLTIVGDGSVIRVPDRALYAKGETVIVSATPSPGWAFMEWGGAIAGSVNPDTVVVGDTVAVTVTFASVATAAPTPSLSRLAVRQNVPNPFSGSTVIDVGLPRAGAIDLEVFDVAGRRVFARRIERGAGGWNRIEFNERRLPAGVYFYRVRSAREVVTRKMVLLK